MGSIYKTMTVDVYARTLTDESTGVRTVQFDQNVDGILLRVPSTFSAVNLADSGTAVQVLYTLPGSTQAYLQPLDAYTLDRYKAS